MRWAPIVGFGLLPVGIMAASAWLLWDALYAPMKPPVMTAVDVPRGATLKPVLEELAQHGVVRHPFILYAYARLRGQASVRSGSYEFAAQQSPMAILSDLREGRVRLEAFTLAEGLNRWQVRKMLVEGRWLKAAEFDALCDNPAFLAANHIAGPTCEGYLFPDTYKMVRGLPASSVLQTMLHKYHQEIAQLRQQHGTGPLHLAENDLVTLASIVEKETGDPQERPRIACVFYNRLRAQPPWRLETDPTVIYAATLADARFDGNIKRTHLRTLDSPYNTYRRFGLPPGPIANPGRGALEAVCSPSACDDFFFVSTNHGRHIFCPTLACHNAAVRKWQIDYFRRPTPAVLPDAPSGGGIKAKRSKSGYLLKKS